MIFVNFFLFVIFKKCLTYLHHYLDNHEGEVKEEVDHEEGQGLGREEDQDLGLVHEERVEEMVGL